MEKREETLKHTTLLCIAVREKRSTLVYIGGEELEEVSFRRSEVYIGRYARLYSGEAALYMQPVSRTKIYV